jgi:hypothetical protein
MKKKKAYSTPRVTRVQIDREISMVMMSGFGPTSDPEGSMTRFVHPLRWFR